MRALIFERARVQIDHDDIGERQRRKVLVQRRVNADEERSGGRIGGEKRQQTPRQHGCERVWPHETGRERASETTQNGDSIRKGI